MPHAPAHSIFAVALVVITFAASLWLRQAFPVFALGPVTHDDALFVKLARHLCDGDWLGPYDNLTLAKGAGYPMFVCAAHAVGLPLKVAEHLVYLGAALHFACVVGMLWRSRAATVAVFVVLAFNPVFWAPEIGGRVIRENLYQSLSLLLLSLAIQAYVASRGGNAVLAAVGVVGGVFWLTREEGAWLAPSLAVLLAWGVYQARSQPRRWYALIGVPVVAFAAVVGSVNALNWHYYGSFHNNDFRSRDFRVAYGALARITHDRWMPHVVFPLDARERAYAASPAARELRPYLDGSGGEMWRQTGCPGIAKVECPEIRSGWFMWALRDAVAAAGHYTSAREARAYYRRLAREVNAACSAGTIACGPRHDSLVPPWRADFIAPTWAASLEMFEVLASLGRPRVYIEPSMGPEDRLQAFRDMIHGPIAAEADVARDDARVPVARAIAEVQVRVTAIALPAAIVAWLVLLGFAVHLRRWDPSHVVAGALLAAIAMRVALLGFLDATSIQVNRSLYPSPAVAMALAFAPVVAMIAWRLWKSR